MNERGQNLKWQYFGVERANCWGGGGWGGAQIVFLQVCTLLLEVYLRKKRLPFRAA